MIATREATRGIRPAAPRGASSGAFGALFLPRVHPTAPIGIPKFPKHAGRSRWGYSLVPVATPTTCAPPIVRGRLAVTRAWTMLCFLPAYRRAALRWGNNTAAIVAELVFELVPSARLGRPETGAEHELRRRIELAVAVLQGEAGRPIAYPRLVPLPRRPWGGPAWQRALVQGRIGA